MRVPGVRPQVEGILSSLKSKIDLSFPEELQDSLFPSLWSGNFFDHLLREKEKDLSQEQLHATHKAQIRQLRANKFTICKLVGCIQNRITDVRFPARKPDIFICVRVFIMWLSTW